MNQCDLRRGDIIEYKNAPYRVLGFSTTCPLILVQCHDGESPRIKWVPFDECEFVETVERDPVKEREIREYREQIHDR